MTVGARKPSGAKFRTAAGRPSPSMPSEPIDEGKPVADQRTSGRPPALRTAVESMTLLAAAVIVHDKESDRVVLLQRGPGAKYGNGLRDLPADKSDPGEPITETTVRELREETGLVVGPRSLRRRPAHPRRLGRRGTGRLPHRRPRHS